MSKVIELDDEYLDWYNEKPEIIKKALNILPPDKLYKIKSTDSQCYIYSFEEPSSGLFKDITLTVYKTGIVRDNRPKLGDMVMGEDNYRTAGVFGLKIEDLEPWIDIEI